MKRTCSDCGQPLLVKNTAREHYTMGQGYSYRCKDCAKKLVAALIERTRAGLGLPR
jgi:predicted SprT family Zn-dependent metalloprotease